jgi:hypothetical protein
MQVPEKQLHDKIVLPDLLALLKMKEVDVTRIVQRPGDVIITAEGAYHWGITLSVSQSGPLK